MDRNTASFDRVDGLPNQPPEASMLYQSFPCRNSISTGMAHACLLPSGSIHSSIRPHSLPSAPRVMPLTRSGGPSRIS